MLLRIALLLFGVYACATAVIMIKAPALRQIDPVLLAAWRLLIAAAALTPLLVRDWRRCRAQFTRRHLAATLLPGLMLALHFITWIIGAKRTQAAHASLIVNMVPIVLPFFLFALIRERLTRGELLATVVALGGVSLLATSDFRVSREFFAGDVLCFVSMLLFALYLALARKNRTFPTIWLYIVPLYYVAALICLGAALVRVNPIRPYGWQELLLILGLGIVPTVIGHSILNYSLKHIRGQVVSLVNLAQFVFAGIMGFFFYNEAPRWPLYVAAASLVAGVTIALRSQPEAAPALPPDTTAAPPPSRAPNPSPPCEPETIQDGG